MKNEVCHKIDQKKITKILETKDDNTTHQTYTVHKSTVNKKV